MPEVTGLVRIADVPLYAVDAITRRAKSLQMTSDAVSLAVAINSDEAQRQSLTAVANVDVQQQGETQQLPLIIDERIPDGCVLISAGATGSEFLGRYAAAVKISAIKS